MAYLGSAQGATFIIRAAKAVACWTRANGLGDAGVRLRRSGVILEVMHIPSLGAYGDLICDVRQHAYERAGGDL